MENARLWYAIKNKNRNTVVYVDRKTDRYYSYSSTSGSIYLGNSLGYLKEKKLWVII